MKGVQYVVDENGRKTAVVIDLKRHAALWEDFCDVAVARSRAGEPRESLAAVKASLRRRGKLRADG
ncbi:MAG: hypothetical protein D6766_03090 [Verrucomicrobia bacterium]|nr:MAG: hypothetical protein D6766_03090 [Verrucomicrobiota bacterium]